MLRLSRLIRSTSIPSSLFLSARGSGRNGRKGGGGSGGGIVSGGGDKGRPTRGVRIGDGEDESVDSWNFDISAFTRDLDGGLLLPRQGKPHVSPSRRQMDRTVGEERKRRKGATKAIEEDVLESEEKRVAAEETNSTCGKKGKSRQGKEKGRRNGGEEEEEVREMHAVGNDVLRSLPVPVAKERETTSPSTDAALSNPFRGLHEHITRSYRLDQLLVKADPSDLLLARQEGKSGAFSFMRFESNPQFLADPSTGKIRTNNSRDYALTVAERLLHFPPHLRHFHSICSRENVPCDFFADVDLPNETPEGGERILLEMLNYLDVRLQGIGFLDPSFLILTNEVPSSDKVSYHVHARAMGSPSDLEVTDEDDAFTETDDATDAAEVKPNSKGKGKKHAQESETERQKKSKKGNKSSSSHKKILAFQDFRVLRLLAEEVNQTLGRTVIDEQCYRVNGMLRCAYSSKVAAPSPGGSVPSGPPVNQRGKRLVPLRTASDTALQRRLREMHAQLESLSEAQILERTFGVRFAPLAKGAPRVSQAEFGMKEYMRHFKVIRARHILGPKSAQPMEFDAYGNAVSPFLTEGAKWRRFKAVIAKLRHLPPQTAESYDVWVRVGLALHNFSNDDHVFEEWVRFSLRCPQKYSRESCRKKWQQFERNPDALNWRRGFNYLNSSIWRSVQGE